ncbi:sensor histidine kinase [Desulfurobacterium atlanticum]|uniref:histidine kinase n=1 Tax=Desulfurobacterium atlanticum TaxID=240169 RepID=A0A238XJT8_9BACT|nr:ATP-binding protein [Desulfurobacterium atlanticum]SNR59187.1 two-component system, NtrC family, nitrogen regulation sensor histidine kinase NtrY [Desulfurobacterium atlanticum]
MLKSKRVRKRILNIAGLLTGFFILAFFGTKFLSWISGKFYLSNPSFHILFSINLLLLLVIFVFLIRNIFLLFVPYRSTRLRFKLVTAFSLLILGPALFSVFISTNFINRGLDRLFKLQMKRSIETAVSVGSATFDLLSDDVASFLKTFPSFKRVNLKKSGFEGICRITGEKVECRGKIDINPDLVKNVVDVSGIYSRLNRKNRSLTVCIKRGGRYYCALKKLPEKFMKNLSQLEQLKLDYSLMKSYEKPIKGVYTATFFVMGVLVLVGAFWFARYFEKMINVPVEALYRATRKISTGNLDVKIEVEGTDELRNVISAFNYMVEQLKALKNRLEMEKRYIENIINAISPAVITISKDGQIISFNSAAKTMLGDLKRGISPMKAFKDFPEFRAFLSKLIVSGGGREEVKEIIDGKERIFSVEVVKLPDEGFVVIIEDITKIVSAQKMSAWREVAQRLAHEIKNPLTPISLSAERIKRIIGKQDFPQEKKEIIDRAVSLILEEVESIRRLIDEFRMFARLPLPDKRLEDINKLINDFVSSYKEKISVVIDLASDIPAVPVDKRLLREVLLNLMENSIDAGADTVYITTTYRDNKVFIVFRDNGPGVPEELGDTVFSPHISTKKTGWGLGLAIAKKIVEDHGGKIFLADRNTFIIELPV